jgi:hypothetical protein
VQAAHSTSLSAHVVQAMERPGPGCLVIDIVLDERDLPRRRQRVLVNVRALIAANLPWRLALRLALLAAVWLSPLLIGRLPPLSLSDRATREAALAALGSSRLGVLRQLLFVLKSVAGFCYGAPSDAAGARAELTRAGAGG